MLASRWVGSLVGRQVGESASRRATASLPTKILDFWGFDSSRILISRDGIPRPIVDFQEHLSQAILVGMILVGELGVVSRGVREVGEESGGSRESDEAA